MGSIGDAMRGDPALFAREDGVEAAWAVGSPILGVAEECMYQQDSWGTVSAGRISAADDSWRVPAEAS
jgi:glucose-6-phosphate 1-dehydrogenase